LKKNMTGKLILEDKTEIIGESFGANIASAGEVVFATGMMGYPESLTDPSYKGQILILTYPLIGNYGVPEKNFWESDNIMVSGLVVSTYNDTPSHFQSKKTLAQWFKEENVSLLEIKDTRFLTQKIREKGTMLGKIIFEEDIQYYDPNKENLVDKVSIKKPNFIKGPSSKTVLLIDCGAKRNIERSLLKRGINVLTIPWDFDPFTEKNMKNFSAIVVSNGPGDPKLATKTIQTVRKAMEKKIPILGICLGNQILALAAGGDTEKLKYGHRSQNQPCRMESSNRCYITTQNHGFAVSKIPSGFKPWFTNANDSTNEGIIHKTLPFMSVQFHPEATPGPQDADWIFDYFLNKI
jgi:carbamoyl-phosphate synthase small subunit